MVLTKLLSSHWEKIRKCLDEKHAAVEEIVLLKIIYYNVNNSDFTVLSLKHQVNSEPSHSERIMEHFNPKGI